ncbi:MAG: HAD hydrolase family protein [Chloroflexota bacterium]|nr:HAD hydrolase family protein [Chloroflexota bacterium]
MSGFICFDLEGPLSPQDNAYDLMSLLPHGNQVFEAISRYDDLLTLEERKGYEPGDTLALIAPFLICHGITEQDIRKFGKEAKLITGAVDLITHLQSNGWKVFCISTSYNHYALTITSRLNIPKERVACTPLPLSQWAKDMQNDTIRMLEQAVSEIVSIDAKDDVQLKEYLDEFFWHRLTTTQAGNIIRQVSPVGGSRKVMALERFSKEYGQPIGNFVAVGDSITDSKMLTTVDRAGGISIAFNANEYALSSATASLASTHLNDLEPVLTAWEQGHRQAAKQAIQEQQYAKENHDRLNFHWAEGATVPGSILEVHRRIRRLVRAEAAKLG